MTSEMDDQYTLSSTSAPKVSFNDEPLILIDEQDRVLGYGAKADVHRGSGALHRAFSVFLFDSRGKLLMQQRNTQKHLWPGYWSNSCCSHPRRGETTLEAARRRAFEELGVDVSLEFVYQFQYHARYRDQGAEHELCSVYLARSDQPVSVNDNEVADIRWISAQRLTSELLHDCSAFTPWLSMEWQCLTMEHTDVLASYANPGGAGSSGNEA
jgi:isopentenyl-diphosphate delta-isomerase